MGRVDQVPRAGELYIGGLYALYQTDPTRAAGITHVPSVIGYDPLLRVGFRHQHLHIRANDHPNEDLLQYEAAIDSDASSGGGRVVFLSEKVQQAFMSRDGAALANSSLNTQNDYERLTRTMYDSQLDPFNQVTLDDGKVVHFYGDESTYVWATIVEKEGPEPEEQDVEAALKSNSKRGVVPKATIEIGHFSADGGEASSFWSEVPRLTTDAILATAVFKLVQGSVHSFLLRNLPATAGLIEAKKDLNGMLKKIENGEWSANNQQVLDFLEEAGKKVGSAETAVIAESAEAWSITSTVAKNIEVVGGIVGTVTAIVGTLLFDKVIAPFFLRDYTVKVNVINLDHRAWTIDKWYEDNAIITGNKDFKPVTLDPPSGRKVPFMPKEADFKEATSKTYTFQNSFPVFAGLGFALQVTSPQDSNTGFMFGYDAPRIGNNNLAIRAGIPTSPEEWYGNDDNWTSPDSLSANDTIAVDGDRVEVRALTDALSGNDNYYYQVWVVIGSVES
ncbi:hypothetical protein SVAN01_03383 [Stagonosporopsis vannaccii]|nr:hypothetical protein SVAN01_03383 [Stagonosporopsis vannaccii]